MTMTNTTPDAALAAIQEFWSGGDYDRLASYGSAAEASHLVRFAGVNAGDHVLDVGTGSGIVAIVAAQRGAGLDFRFPSYPCSLRCARKTRKFWS